MNFVKPQNREQITFGSLAEKITKDNTVRFVDAFVEHLELEKLNFFVPDLKTEGRIGFELGLFSKYNSCTIYKIAPTTNK